MQAKAGKSPLRCRAKCGQRRTEPRRPPLCARGGQGGGLGATPTTASSGATDALRPTPLEQLHTPPM